MTECKSNICHLTHAFTIRLNNGTAFTKQHVAIVFDWFEGGQVRLGHKLMVRSVGKWVRLTSAIVKCRRAEFDAISCPAKVERSSSAIGKKDAECRPVKHW